ncbi:hypothetical protein BLA60_24710 [Actinophytocola xinjiangensis]|uniref:DUF305 domain-containing protein n=1 Tax=Actinophytocola xinjiangensis TaxID=485602 RepID=A0A7Z1AWK5_9PSEU|nr:DUF305 domain-containing protein [Actinophytocola xinjiangensis]OLF08072.1 hypothetical protein BLA60_24710 [Actinophytocola xinjiangensis]
MTDTDTDASPPTSNSSRVLIIVAAMVAVLLVGAAGGMLLAMSRSNDVTPGPDSVDVGFAQDMRVHHLQAVTMAGIERDRTDDGELRRLAFDIESTQLAQASEMAGWLTVWGRQSLPDPGAGHMEWMSQGGTHEHTDALGQTTTGAVDRMPGMATSQELDQLRAATGRELDVLFLQLMLRHHQGGLQMAEYGAQHASAGYVRNLAKKIVSSQVSEVNLLTDMLTRRGAQPLPPA